MPDLINHIFDYNRPNKIAEDVYWVGVYDVESRWLSSPYLIVDQDEAVLIDGGSRGDFATVMMKIMQIGIIPSSIVALIYQNYDPRLCGSLAHLEVIINRKDLRIFSDQSNLMFVQHHSESANLQSLEEVDFQFEFSSGRRLSFIKTPFAHSAGSFVTFDHRSGILFSGDLFSSYARQWSLLLTLKPECRQNCAMQKACPVDKGYCPLFDIAQFHQQIMSAERALRFALDRIAQVPFTTIAPQHGSVIHRAEDIITVCECLSSLKGVGIDGTIGERSFFELGNTAPIRARLMGSGGLVVQH